MTASLLLVVCLCAQERNGVKLRNASSAQLINPQGALAKELKFEQKRYENSNCYGVLKLCCGVQRVFLLFIFFFFLIFLKYLIYLFLHCEFLCLVGEYGMLVVLRAVFFCDVCVQA